MKDYTMLQYASREDLYADMRKDIEELTRQRDENEKKWLESAEAIAEYRSIDTAAGIRRRFDILIKLYNLLGADDVQAVDRLEEVLRENSDLMARVEELSESLEFYRRDDAEDDYRVADKALSIPTLGASDRLRDKHYRECEEIAKPGTGYNALDPFDRGHAHGQNFASDKIARARGGK